MIGARIRRAAGATALFALDIIIGYGIALMVGVLAFVVAGIAMPGSEYTVASIFGVAGAICAGLYALNRRRAG